MNIASTRLPARTQARPTQESKPAPKPECPEKDPGFVTRTADFLSTGAKNTLQEGVLAAKNDPALAMRVAATALSDTILKKVDPSIRGGFDKTIVPVMRLALLGGNVLRAKNTFSDPLASRTEKTIDATVVACDLVGAIGGIALLASSRLAGAGEMMMGFSYAVDAISHAYRGLDHAGKRIEFWAAKSEAKDKAPEA